MTIHNSKGLEFPNIFITGIEEGLFPHSLSLDKPKQMEEERRLFYVAITRAMERVSCTYANIRSRFANIYSTMPSRFLKELPEEFVDFKFNKRNSNGYSQFGRVNVRSKPKNYGNSSFEKSRESSQEILGKKNSKEKNTYRVGSIVKNPYWGNGIVTKIENISSGLKLTINFNSVGKKKIIAQYAKLDIVKY